LRTLHIFLFFFFSSRRRHTRFKCDWSSDVCSSDLVLTSAAARKSTHRATVFSPLHFSSGKSSRTSFQTVFVMESTQDRIGHHLVINRNAVSPLFGPLRAGR